MTTRTLNAIQRSLRCLGERGFALLTGRWRTLRHITASPSKIGEIARAALVLTHFEHGYITGTHHPKSPPVLGLAGSMLKHSLDYRRAGSDTQVHA
jgi:hypothetical protein